MTTGESCELWQQVSIASYDNRWVLWVLTIGESCGVWQQVNLVSHDNRWVLWDMTTGDSCELWQQVSIVRYDNGWVLLVITGWKFSIQSTETYLNLQWMLKEWLCPRVGSNPGILFLVFFKPVRYLYATLLHIGYGLIWIAIRIHF